MLPPVRPALDPLAQRAAINALEAQRAAYRRYARAVEDQSRAVGGGDVTTVATAAEVAERGFDELEAGARNLHPYLHMVRQQGSPDQQADVQHRLDTLASDADRAQTSILNLTAQLDAWRTAYSRQLAAVGLTPGGSTSGMTSGNAAGDPTAVRGVEVASPDARSGDGRARDPFGYGPRGQPDVGHAAPPLLNRIG